MWKFFTALFVSILIISCIRTKDVKLIHANFIDIAFNDIENKEVHEIIIDKNGVIKKHYSNHPYLTNKECYVDTLKKEEVDSINYFLTNLKSGKFKSFYNNRVHNGDCYNIRILFGNGSIHSMTLGRVEISNQLIDFARYIVKIKLNPTAKVCSCDDFIHGKLWIPPPPEK